MATDKKKKTKNNKKPSRKQNKCDKPVYKKQYNQEQLQKALNDIRNGMAMRKASREYNIPRGTLQDRLHGRVPEDIRRKGPSTVLTKVEEKAVANWCRNLVKCGFPIKKEDLLNTVAQIIKADSNRQPPFKDGRPGVKWYNSFMKRHSLAARSPESISEGRAVITEELIRSWFGGLLKSLEEEGVEDILEDPKRIVNGDETSLQLCPKTGKVIAPIGYKNVYQVSTGPEKEAITVLLFCTASGKTLPPCVVFPYIRPPRDLIESLPDEWILGKSDSGWMKTDVFYDYFVKSLNPWLNEKKIKRPVLVLVDGHKSHLTLKLSEFCAENQIILYPLPPNTTHMMQPADVSVFKPLKSEWQKTVRDWQMQPENLNSHLSKNKFCPLLKKQLDSTNLTDAIKNGFKKSGLYPFDPDAIDYTKCVQNTRENLEKNIDTTIEEKSACKEKTSNSLDSKKPQDPFDVTLEVLQSIKHLFLDDSIDYRKILSTISDAKSLRDNSLDSLSIINDQNNNEANDQGNKNDSVELHSLDELNIVEDYLLVNSIESVREGIIIFDGDLAEEVNVDTENFIIDASTLVQNCDDSQNSSNANCDDRNNINNNSFKHLGTESTIKAVGLSENFQSKLVLPPPIPKSNRPKISNPVGAITKAEWREVEKQKQQEKEAKQNAILQRKELRLQTKKQKEEEREAKKKQRELKKRIPEEKEDESNDLEKTSAIHNIETEKRCRGRPRKIFKLSES